MSGRFIQFVGRASGAASVDIEVDGETMTVLRDAVVSLPPLVARELLRDPGAADDALSEWVPAPRPDGV